MNTMGPAAIDGVFRAAASQGRAALIAYLTLGYPTPADTPALGAALQAGGADIIELGVPFSDPIADGPVIQRASQVALRAGVTPAGCLRMAQELRRNGIHIPLILMGYYNPILSYGIERYAADCALAGVDGLIVPDLPLEEAGALSAACRRSSLALIFLAAPTSGASRLARIAALTEGFLYLISRLGTTGAGQGVGQDWKSHLALARQYARTPIAVGFGISRPRQVRALAPLADGIIVGSAIVERAARGAEALHAYVATLRRQTEGRRR